MDAHTVTPSRMPKLTPLPIRTKGKSLFARIKAWVTDVRQWQLVENWEYDLPDGRRILIPKGFVFDGASIPRPLWALLSPTGLLLIPGLIHDFGYRYDYIYVVGEEGEISKQDEGKGQDHWDEMFYRVAKQVNGMKLLDWLAWLALTSFGWLSWKSNRERNAEEIIPTRVRVPT